MQKKRNKIGSAFKLRWLVFAAALLLLIPSAVFADNLQNDVTAGGTITITAPGSTDVTYQLVANSANGDIAGCNVDSTHPATLNMTTPSGVVASTATVAFTSCGSVGSKKVTFSSSTPGSYAITHSISGGLTGALYKNQANFTLVVNAATPSNMAPVLTVPNPDIVSEATSLLGAVVTYSATAVDAEDGPLTPICSPASGSTFALGISTVSCSVTDSGGLTTIQIFHITVKDTTAPVIAVHGDVTAEASSAAGAVVNYTGPSTSDAVDGAGVATCVPASGSQFALSSTTVTCNATDAHNNAATPTTFVVHVVDTTAPIIAAHGDVSAEATSAAGAAVSYTSPATSDAVDGAQTASCMPASGGIFALGDTTVTCNATDAHGNAATPTTFKVTVRDTTPPIIASHADVTAEATSAAGAVVNYTSPATSDAVAGAGTASCSPVSGGPFALGNTTVACNATDAAGNHATATTFVVHVVDTTPPVIASHADVTVEATSASGAVVNYSSPATSDAVDGAGMATCLPASGGTFALGNITVTCNATDAHGNAATSTMFVVHVLDTTAPAVTVPGNMTVEATGLSGAAVSFSVSATDIVDGAVPPTCVPASGSTFAIGTTTVNCSATDAHSNTGYGSFTVKIQDTTAPVIAAHADVIATATSAAGAIVNYTPPATSDAVDGAGMASCVLASGSQFPLGNTTVTCNATDSHGNQATATTFVVKVQYLVGGSCLGSPSHAILQPINFDNTSVFKQGSTVPAKFRVCDANGNSIGTPGVVTSFKLAKAQSGTIVNTIDEAVDSTTPDTAFRWDPTAQQWIFNINTKSLKANFTYFYDIALNDGTHILFQFGLK